MPYDDVDPNALQGIIVFDGALMDAVWTRCEVSGLRVVADVHTHPGSYEQSLIDQMNPMIPQRGHLALIIPNFANRCYRPGEFGIYEYCGTKNWKNHSREGSRIFRMGLL